MDKCPHCENDLSAGEFSRRIGYEVPHVYDEVIFWVCPDCGGTWDRFSKDDHPRLYELGRREMKKMEEQDGRR